MCKYYFLTLLPNMKIRLELCIIVYTLLLFSTNVNGLPFIISTPSIETNSLEYQILENNWNISSLARSVQPHLKAKHDLHQVPPRKSNAQIDEELLASLRNIKVGF